MKKLILLVLVLLLVVSGALFGQYNKNIKAGNFMLGGGLSFSPYMQNRKFEFGGEEVAAAKYTQFAIAANALGGYFVTDGLEIGLAFFFDYYNTKYKESENVYIDMYYGIGPQVCYFFDLGGSLAPYVSAAVLYRGSTEKTKPAGGGGTTSKTSGFVIEPRAGVNIFITDSVAFDLGLFFNYIIRKDPDSDPEEVNKYMIIGLLAGINVFL